MNNESEDKRLRLAIEFVRLGYGDMIEGAPFRSLYFRTEVLTTTEAQTVLRVLPILNAFDGERVANAIERFRNRVRGWEVGRAGSPLVQIELAFWTHQVEGIPPNSKGARINDASHERLIQELTHVFVGELNANTCEVVDERRHTLQAWWG